jgi:hypothetical protein
MSLIVEPYPECIDAASGLKQALADATTACALQGWNVVLLEKPLHGLQDQPLKAIIEAREVMDRNKVSHAVIGGFRII